MLRWTRIATGGLWALLAACSSTTSSGGDAGGSTGSCSLAPYGACNDQSPTSLHAFDAVHGCIAASAPVAGVCASSVFAGSCASASLGPDCAFAPDGAMYLTMVRGDEYLSGTGWRSTYYPDYGTARPAADQASQDDLARCAAAQCAPTCPGVVFDYWGATCLDAGAADTGARD